MRPTLSDPAPRMSMRTSSVTARYRLRPFVAIATTIGIGCRSAAPLPVVLDPGGCALQQVTHAPAGEGHFQFHGPDRSGTRLVVGWYRAKETGAYLLDLRRGTRHDLAGINNAGPISADGRHALIATVGPGGDRDVVELDLETMATRVLVPSPRPEFLATYRPGGGGLLFNSYRTGRSDLYTVDADSAVPVRLTAFDGYDAHGDWSPDGRWIAFHREVAKGDYDVLVLDPKTGEERALASGPGEQAYPAWSPDGRWIAYASDLGNPAGKLDLYLTDPAGAATIRLTRHPGYNTYPAWSADGAWLYFNSEREGFTNVFRLRLGGDGGCRPLTAFTR